jgi:ABC-2 type transport system ATP-binding protein
MSILEFKSISYNVGKTPILSEISFAVKKNSIHALVGPNGAGKSTILKLALGLLHPNSGQIKIANRGLSDRDNLRHIGSLIESVSLYNHLSVFENLFIIAMQHGLVRTRIHEVLDIIGLSNQQQKKAKNLSIGLRQRLGIGMAIIHRPKLLLLDEPTNGLDPEGVIAIRELLRELNSSLKVAIVISSHLLNEVDELSDDISLIQNGSITFSGTSKEFNKSHNIEQEYLNRIK